MSEICLKGLGELDSRDFKTTNKKTERKYHPKSNNHNQHDQTRMPSLKSQHEFFVDCHFTLDSYRDKHNKLHPITIQKDAIKKMTIIVENMENILNTELSNLKMRALEELQPRIDIVEGLLVDINNLFNAVDSTTRVKQKEEFLFDFLNKEKGRAGVDSTESLRQKIYAGMDFPVVLHKEEGKQYGEVFTLDGKTRLCFFGYCKTSIVENVEQHRPVKKHDLINGIDWNKDHVTMQMIFINPYSYESILMAPSLNLRRSSLNCLKKHIQNWVLDNFEFSSPIHVTSLQNFRFNQAEINLNLDGILWMKKNGGKELPAYDDTGKITGSKNSLIGVAKIEEDRYGKLVTQFSIPEDIQDSDTDAARKIKNGLNINRMVRVSSNIILKASEMSNMVLSSID